MMDAICRERLKNNTCPIRCAINAQIKSHLPAPERAVFGVATRDAIARLIRSSRGKNLKQVYIRSLLYYTKRFANEYPVLTAITTEDVEKWLRKYSGYTRQTWLNRISTLLAYAQRRAWVNNNPCDAIDRVSIDRKEPIILSVTQAKLIYQTCPSILRPYLVLAMYAGVRPDGELMKMTWDHINLEAGTATVNFPKVRKQRRIVKLEPIAIELLKQHPHKQGPIAPSKTTVRRWKRKIRKILGMERFPQDVFRHTAASYLIELHNDVAKVARLLGNSPNILMTHYAVPVAQKDCQLFWNTAGHTKYD